MIETRNYLYVLGRTANKKSFLMNFMRSFELFYSMGVSHVRVSFLILLCSDHYGMQSIVGTISDKSSELVLLLREHNLF